jgi:excisionase family DNA binding protein
MTAPALTVRPVPAEQSRVSQAAAIASDTGRIDLNELPEDLRAVALLALEAYARGEQITAIVEGGAPLTTTEAAGALGVSRTHLTRMFHEGRIEGFYVGSHLRIPAAEITRILVARAAAMTEARLAASTADQRRRDRAARLAGL